MDKPVDMTPLFDRSHIINLALVLIIVVIGLPLALFLPSRQPAQIAGNSLQMLAYNPSFDGQKTDAPYIKDHAIVRFKSSVSIQTKPGVNQTDGFTPDDITGGLSQDYISILKSVPVSYLTRLGPPITNGAPNANKYVANMYEVILSPSTDMSSSLKKLCSQSITMYCEPDYAFALIPADAPNGQGTENAATQSSTDSKNTTFGLIDAPLPQNYSQVASTLNLPQILQSQIMPPVEPAGTDNSNALHNAYNIRSELPDAKFIYAGSCGKACSSSSLVQGILYSIEKGANALYLSEAAIFPQGVEPKSLTSAIYYAQSKKIPVLAADPRNIIDQPTSQNFFQKIISIIVKQTDACFPCILPGPGKIIEGAASETVEVVKGAGETAYNAINDFKDSRPKSCGFGHPCAGSSSTDSSYPSSVNNVLTPPPTGVVGGTAIGNAFGESGPSGSNDSPCKGWNACLALAKETLQAGSVPDEPTDPAPNPENEAGQGVAKSGTGVINKLKGSLGSGSNTSSGGQPSSGGTTGGLGQQFGQRASAAPAAPVYNFPPQYLAGQQVPNGFNPALYGGYNPPNAPLLGVGYSALCPNGSCTGSAYSGNLGPQNQGTAAGSAYGLNYGYTTMQYTAAGVYQAIGFGYGNQNPTDPSILNSGGNYGGLQVGQVGQTSTGQNVGRTQGGYIFGGNGEL